MKNTVANLFLLLTAVFCFIVIGSIFSARAKNEEAFIMGFKPYIIQTGSMEPTMKVNSLMLVQKGGFETLKKDQVIVFFRPGLKQPISHRLIEFTEKGLVTKGDNNDAPDDFLVTRENYLGKMVVCTNLTADFITLTKSRAGQMLIVLPIIILTVTISSWLLIFNPEGRRANNRKNNADEQPILDNSKKDIPKTKKINLK